MFLETSFFSKELKTSTQVNIIIPDSVVESDEPLKTLWLLHGLKGDHASWMRYTSIERYANRYNLAVIMPNVARSWYTNTAYNMNYYNFVAKELPTFCRKIFSCISDKREDNIIAGLSMGGYGAIKIALTCPEQYGHCLSLSGALDITRKGRPCNINEWRSIFGFDMESPLELENSEHDVYALAKKNKEAGIPFPKLYLWCGLEDTLLNASNEFDNCLTELGVEHKYETSEGTHNWRWWDLHITDGLDYILDVE